MANSATEPHTSVHALCIHASEWMFTCLRVCRTWRVHLLTQTRTHMPRTHTHAHTCTHMHTQMREWPPPQLWMRSARANNVYICLHLDINTHAFVVMFMRVICMGIKPYSPHSHSHGMCNHTQVSPSPCRLPWLRFRPPCKRKCTQSAC